MDNKKKLEMLEVGRSIGEIFVSELDALARKYKHTLRNQEEEDILDFRAELAMLSGSFLAQMITQRISPEVWPELISIIQNHTELLISEGKRVAKKDTIQ